MSAAESPNAPLATPDPAPSQAPPPPAASSSAPHPPDPSPPPPPPPPPAASSSSPDPPTRSQTPNPDPGTTPDPDPSTPGKPRPSRAPGRTTGGAGANPTHVPGAGGNNGNNGNNNNGGNNNGGIGDGTTGNSTKDGQTSSSSSLAGPIVGGIAGVLVVAFLVGVFVMRYRKKNRARQRRLDILLDQNGQGQDQVHALGLTGDGTTAATGGDAGAVKGSPGPRRPSTHLEMNAIGAGAMAAHQQHPYGNEGYENYDYQQGYQQVPYGQYQEQYDQYDPYYQQPGGGQLPPVGYYHPENSPQLQQQQQLHPYGAGSPSVAHAVTGSPSLASYPQHVPSPLTPQPQQAVGATATTSGEAHVDYTQSPTRNPQTFTDGHASRRP
ncbi:hypothetical protein BGX28_003892 [Mortierella sp. GBA30]|nr:hypothetical protein BGX28_003892 [Mortierella sp. GBA30]